MRLKDDSVPSAPLMRQRPPEQISNGPITFSLARHCDRKFKISIFWLLIIWYFTWNAIENIPTITVEIETKRMTHSSLLDTVNGLTFVTFSIVIPTVLAVAIVLNKTCKQDWYFSYNPSKDFTWRNTVLLTSYGIPHGSIQMCRKSTVSLVCLGLTRICEIFSAAMSFRKKKL